MASPTTHAFLSPSQSHRWLECTPSAMLESAEPSSYSPYAEEGTEAHELAEIKLSYALGKIDENVYTRRFDEFRLKSKFYNEEFNEYVNKYVDEVMTIVTYDYQGQDVRVELEERVKFDDIVPSGAGTSDCVIIGKNFIHIVDLKFGKGVAVSAIDNPQLRLYALGAIRKHISECVCNEVIMTIVQPRLDDRSTDRMLAADLNWWANNVVKPKAQLAIAGQGELNPGDHCKFCKCRGKCQALADKQLAVAQAEFENVVVENNILEPCNMTPEMLAKVLYLGPRFQDWFKDVMVYATKAAIMDGVQIPGYKIVEGKSNRVITSPESIIEKLKTNGYTEEEYLKPRELQGITTLERNIGKKKFAELCGDYICKPTGKPTLVPEADKRVALDVRALRLNGDEFADIVDTDEN